MKRTGEFVTLNGVANPALNVYGQAVMQTGLSVGGNDGLLMLGALVEFSDAMGSVTQRDVALVRGTKLAMPTILDDDVLVKRSDKSIFVTSGFVVNELTVSLELPPQALVVVESNLYFGFKLTGATVNMTATVLVTFERVVLTEPEKSAILATRLNNLLN